MMNLTSSTHGGHKFEVKELIFIEKNQKEASLPQVVIQGYKVKVQVTDRTLNLTEVLDDLLGRHLEKI